VIFWAIYIAFAIFVQKYKNAEKKPAAYTVLNIIHIVCGVAVTILAVIHGVSRFSTAPTAMIVTGCTTIALLLIQMIVGIFLAIRKNKVLTVIHAVLPIIIASLIIVHAVVAHVI